MAATLLLADDSITIQRVIELTFADEDIRVLVASDGQQAIQKIDSDRPDIVLADIGMPRVDGYAVATHIKESASLKHIPVLLLTGAFEPIDEARARQTGCDGVLVKPFEPQKLVARVKELLGGARGADMWPANMPRTQVEPVRQVQLPPVDVPLAQPETVQPMPELLRAEQFEVSAPPLSVPSAPAVGDLDEFDPVIEPASDAIFDIGEAVAANAEPPALVQPPAALEGEDVANRNGDHDFRQSRAELPPPADRLETELDMLDAALSRLEPTAHPHELDEETASDFARDLKEMRNEARLEDAEVTRPAGPSFGTWDLPQPPHNDTRRAAPIDIVVEEIPLQQPAPAVQAPAPPMPAPVAQAPVVHVPVAPAPAVSASFAPTPVAAAPVALPAPAPAPVVATPAPVAYVPPPIPVVPQLPTPVVHVPVIVAAPVQPAFAAPAALAPPAAPTPPAPVPPIERPTLASAFSALLAAEKSRPAAQAAAPQISEAAIEEVVKRVLARMAGDTVNRVVLETAERLIREEISRTKDPSPR